MRSTKYEVRTTDRYLKQYALMEKRGYDMKLLDDVVERLANGERLPPKYDVHPMGGKWINHWDCHIQPDWVLIYYRDKRELILGLVRTGTHSDLFKK